MDSHGISVDAEDRPIECQEQQPLHEENGVSNGDGGEGVRVERGRKSGGNSIHSKFNIASPSAGRKPQLPLKLDLDKETHNWRGEVSTPSPASSPASSPSNPYRKKLVFTMPGIMRPKKPREYKLRMFVICTFFVLVLLMSLTYVYHQQRLLHRTQLSLGERFRFTETNRLLYITNAAKQNVLTAKLGTTLSPKDLPRNCPIDSSMNETACLQWNYWAQVSIIRLQQSGSTKCYQIRWQSNRDELMLQDCFSLSNAFWYGVGEYTPQLWPMNFLETNNTPFVSGNLSGSVFGHVLERYWMSSKGVAIIASPSFPLDVTIDYDVRGQMCLASRGPRALLNYALCAADDARDVYRHVVEIVRHKPTRPSKLDLAVDNIVWSTLQRFGDKINGTLLKDFTELLQSFERDGSLRPIVLDSRWQTYDGNFTFDPVRFADMKEVARILHNRGYSLVLRVHPYISTASEKYYKYLAHQFWVRDITGQIPSLVRWNHLMSAVVIDFTNAAAVRWFQQELERLHVEYKVVGFQFNGGETTTLPPYATFNSRLASLDDYTTLYNEIAINSSFAFSVGVISRLQTSMPAFTELSSRFSVWGLPRGLRSIIPAVLSTSLAGYPFTMIGPVGGYQMTGIAQYPDRELYVRWLQLAIFFPVLQISILPSDYDEEVTEIAIKCLQLRRAVVLPMLKAAINEVLNRGTPIVRPLWWLSPNDVNTHDIDSEFLVGNDLLVAPILEPHADERDIYLPPGLWTDREGAVHKGGKWIYDHRSSLSKVAYFTRMPDSQAKTQPYSNQLLP